MLLGGLQMALAPVSAQTCRERAESLVSKMTLEEKASLVSGQVDGFHTAAIPRLGIPSIRMADGPQGVRNKTRSTFYPCGISLASTWNPDLAREMGRGLALDARARGIGIMLGPGVNIYRSALCGRNFEYYGEDPVLASAIACGYIEGMQQNGVIATIKHFAANNQEYRRHATNSVVDERTLRELYFPVFKDAVQKAGVGAVMTSYNPLNGIHSAENRWLITDVLRKEWGFDGIVMSDWTSTYTTLGCMESGLDLEMPKGYWLNYKMIRELLDRGIVHERQLDEKCVHILSTLIRFGLLDRPAVDSALPLDNLCYGAGGTCAVEECGSPAFGSGRSETGGGYRSQCRSDSLRRRKRRGDADRRLQHYTVFRVVCCRGARACGYDPVRSGRFVR